MPAALDLIASISTRIVFVLAARHYVDKTLYVDLQQALIEDETEDLELPLSASSSKPRASFQRARGSGELLPKNYALFSRLSTVIFSVTFGECCVLCLLVLFGDLLGEQARWHNWTAATSALLAVIIVIAPFGQCLMLAHVSKNTTSAFTILTALFLLGVYEFALNLGGAWLSQAFSISAGTHAFGIMSTALVRVCVPGSLLIAILSGAGAVNTAWDAYEWRDRFSSRPVTDASLRTTETALSKAREDLIDRRNMLDTMTKTPTSSSFISRYISGNSEEAKRSILQMEVRGLQSLETQMVRELSSMRVRKRTFEMQGTFRGRLFQVVGLVFTVYCVVRVFLAAVNLALGLDKDSQQPKSKSQDYILRLLSGLAATAGLDINVTKWSHFLGLALIGTIILVNMRTLVASISRILRATSAGASASFLLLFLAQLMAMYILTFLISLPESDDPNTRDLLATLPDFAVFLRLFDAAFFVSAVLWSLYRFVERKIRAEDFMVPN